MDKNKVIQVATRYVQKGQLDRAIHEYAKLLKEDPRDVRILLKVGELQQKKGDVGTAARTLLQVAETYSTDGFFLKAVAVYKQVLKLEPGQVELHLKLAELYQQLGLMQDALGQYQLVATHHEKGGNIGAAIDAIRRIVDLEPDNLAGRINLAELFAKEERKSEAVQEFRRAAEALKAQNRAEEYLKVGERIVFLDPNDLALTRELAHLYLARGDTKRALAKLQACFGVDPRHLETLELLGRTFLELGQLTKAASVYKELARVHAEEGNADEARAVWRKILRFAPDDADARAAVEPPAVAPAPMPAQPEAQAVPRGAVLGRIALQPAGGVRPPVPAAPWNADRVAAPIPSVPAPPVDETPRQAMERLIAETDVYVKYGLRDKAFDHLRRLLELDPDCIEAHERASTLFAAGGNQAAAWAELATVCRICAQRGLLERGRPHFDRLRDEAPHLPEVTSLADAYVLSQSQGPAFEAPLELVDGVPEDPEAEISDEIRLEPTGGFPTQAEPPAPEARPAVTADDEALAAAMVSAGTELIDEDAAVVLPGEDDFGFGDEPAPGEDANWFYGEAQEPLPAPGGSGGGGAPGAHGDGVPLLAGVIPDGDGDDLHLSVGAGPGPIGLDELNTLPAAEDLDGGEAIDPGLVQGSEPDHAEPAGGIADADTVGLPDEDEALFFTRSDDEVLEVGDDAIVELPDEEVLEAPSPGRTVVGSHGAGGAFAPDDGGGDVLSLDSAGPLEVVPGDVLSLDSAGPLEVVPGDVLSLDSAGPPDVAPEEVISLDSAGPADLLEADDLLPPDPAAPASLLETVGPSAAFAFAGGDAQGLPAAPGDDADDTDPDDDAPPASAGPAGLLELLDVPADSASPDSFPAPAVPGPLAKAAPFPAAPPPPSSLEVFRLEPEELADLETELAEAEFFLAQGLLTEAEDICRSILFRAPGHPSAEEILRDVAALREAAPPADGEVDLATELALDVDLDAEADAGPNELDYQYAVEDVFQAFKAGVSRTVRPEDSQTHYDLGIAYKEMGLLPDAIEQFGTALAGFRGEPREPDCLSMIAICRREAGEHDEAVARLEEALALPAVDAQTRQALQFELAATHEARGDFAGALTCYAEVERHDPAFRGVGRIVARLRNRAAAPRNNPAT